MNNPSSLLKRVLLAGGLAAAVLGSALITVSPAGADPPKPGQRAATPTPIPGAGPLTLPADPKPVTTTPAAPLTFDRVEITEVGGTRATLVVRASAPTIMSYTLRRVGDAGNGTAGLPNAAYIAEHRVGLPNLQSNTAYEVMVYATNAAGQNAIETRRFTTFKKRVRIILQSIDIKDDGDWIGDGEPSWGVRLIWNGDSSIAGCYPVPAPKCSTGEFGEGRFTPRNSEGKALMFVFAEENFDRFPVKLTLQVVSAEDDPERPDGWSFLKCIFNGGCIVGENVDGPLPEWRVPQGVESAEQWITVRGDDPDTGFESVLTFHFELMHNNGDFPAPSRNMPHSTWK